MPRSTMGSLLTRGDTDEARHNLPITSCRKPGDLALPANGTSCTSRVWPGSKRTAVPAAMSRRWPRALARSNSSAGLVSAKW